jgi:hypothetical protein
MIAIKEHIVTNKIYEIEPQHSDLPTLAAMCLLNFDLETNEVKFREQVVGIIKTTRTTSVHSFTPHGWKEWFQWRFFDRIGLKIW